MLPLLTEHPLDPAACLAAVARPDCGASATFIGTVRDHHAGREVLGLEYSCYPSMAEAECRRIIAEAEQRFAAHVVVQHRLGALDVGAIAVVVAASAPHRDAAFAATRWVIDEVKRRVPIWKHERYADGTSAWVDPTAATQATA